MAATAQASLSMRRGHGLPAFGDCLSRCDFQESYFGVELLASFLLTGYRSGIGDRGTPMSLGCRLEADLFVVLGGPPEPIMIKSRH